MRKFLSIFISLKTTVTCLVWLAAIVFFGTLYQVENGLEASLKVYFYSWILWIKFIPLPGGMATLTLLTVNLIASLLIHFRFGWRMAGLIVVHVGLLLMMIGGVITYYSGFESYLDMREGDVTSVSQSFKDWELAVAGSNDLQRTMYAIDTADLKAGEVLNYDEIGVSVKVVKYYDDALVRYRGNEDVEVNDRLVALSQHLRAFDLLPRALTPGMLAARRQAGKGQAMVVDIIPLPESELSEQALELRSAILREADAVMCENHPSVSNLVAAAGLTEQARFLTGIEQAEDAPPVVQAIGEQKIIVVLLRSGEPHPFMDEMVASAMEDRRLAFSSLQRDWEKAPYDVADFEPKESNRVLRKRFAAERQADIDAALAAIGEEPVNRMTRALLGLGNLVGIKNPKFDAIKDVENRWKRRIKHLTVNSAPERRMPGLVAEVRVDGGEPTLLHIDGGYGMYEEISLDPMVKSGDRSIYFRLQKKRYQLPFLVQLDDFIRTTHVNDTMDKEYISRISVQTLDANFSQQASVEMNKPYRYHGFTIYQTSFDREVSDFSKLTVKFNTGRLLPYVSTIIVFLGLALHFILMLAETSNRKLKS